MAYAPYGEHYKQTGATELSFTGQTLDLISATYDFPFRDYSEITGRWYSPDPAGLGAANPSNPQSWNRYAYVSNMPTESIDPLGLWRSDVVGSSKRAGLGYQYNWMDWLGSMGHWQYVFSITSNQDGNGLPVVDWVYDSFDPGPGNSSSDAANNGTPQTIAQKQQQCVSNFYNSKAGKAVQFGSPLALLPGWNPGWGNNLKEWGIAIVGKLGGLFGSGAMTGTTQLTTLSGTTTVGSTLELGTEATLGAVEKVATPLMAGATVVDIMAHGTCAMEADPAAANAALQAIP